MKFLDKLAQTLKGVAKIIIQSRPSHIPAVTTGTTVTVMANGPSLKKSLAEHPEYFLDNTTIAVNFAPVSDEFFYVKPAYLVLADPHFFKEPGSDANLKRLNEAIARIDWPLTIFVPDRYVGKARGLWNGSSISVCGFNNVGVEGFRWFRQLVYRLKLGMPRPRNVAIPSLMLAIWMGYREILLFGADHSWMQTLSVTDDNEVVSVQPHFYKEDSREEERVRHEYKGYRLHQIVQSFAIAFKSYIDVEDFARSVGRSIVNLTPGSMIDAFCRVRAN